MNFCSAARLNLVHFQTVHQTHRRIRFSIPRIASDQSYANRLKEIITQEITNTENACGILEFRINQSARSLIIDFEPAFTSADCVLDRIANLIEQAGTDLEQKKHSLNSSKVEKSTESLLILAHVVGYDVIHDNSCRTRIRIPRLRNDDDYFRKLKYFVQLLDEVHSFRINSTIASLVVEYTSPMHSICAANRRNQLIEVIQQAAFAEIDDATIEALSEPKTDIDYAERLGLPAVGLLLSFGALLELPFPGLVTGAIIFTAAIPVFKRALNAIRDDRQLTIDFLDGLAISLHTLQGTFFGAALMLGLIEGGEVIRDLTARGSENASLDLLDCLGTLAYVDRDGVEIEVPVKEIVIGDRVIVYPGDQIPVDGCILRGTALIDQCKLTGESVPVVRSEGDEVFAATLVVEGQLFILAERTGSSTRAGVIVNLMQSAPIHDTRVENYAAAVANQMVVPTLLTSAVVGLASGDLNRSIALLTLDLGTGIRISVPTTILSALTFAARNGVLIRSGHAIEILAKVDTVVFDKTGTLTQGHAGVVGIELTQTEIDETELLRLAASAEQGLTHPVADAIVRHAKQQGIILGICEEWEYCVGLGVVAKIEGRAILVGSHRLMAREGICLDGLGIDESNSLVYVAVDSQLFGAILYRDPLRLESQQVILSLHRQGIETYMLSGDVNRVAKSVAAELGIKPDCVYAEAFPEQKVEVVQRLHDSGKIVAFCGDGINDSAALAYADVSISFAGATDIARETADIVLMENNLHTLLQAVQIAKQAMGIIEQNIALVAVPNVSAVIAGVFFALDPLLAILINNGSAILAELNGLRPLLGSVKTNPIGQIDFISKSQQIEEVRSHQNKEFNESNGSGTHPRIPKLAESATQLSNGYISSLISSTTLTLESSAQRDSDNNDNNIVVQLPDIRMAEISATNQTQERQISNLSLKQTDLAKRLGVSSKTLSRHKARSQTEFAIWSRSRDPDRISWNYHPSLKCYFPLNHSDDVACSLNSEQDEIVAETEDCKHLYYDYA